MTAISSNRLSILEDAALQVYPEATLYVVATPIGNVCDISIRALHLLSLADAIACEDTRNSATLLARYGLSKPLIAAHQHNEREVAQKLITRLHVGERIAFISDAGTPGISDPGARIVDAVRSAGLRVMPLPGASAVVTALSASGLLDEQFYFVGFLPAKARQREQILNGLQKLPATLVFYEAPHRIIDCVKALAALFEPTRQIVLARELSKLFETIHRCPLSEALTWLQADPNHLKGEFVVLLQGAPQQDSMVDSEVTRILQILLAECSLKQAATLAAQITGLKKNDVYQRALALRAPGADVAEADDEADEAVDNEAEQGSVQGAAS
jgi:16S rRNA (cytidine1402-2'-O)-methyltransferase